MEIKNTQRVYLVFILLTMITCTIVDSAIDGYVKQTKNNDQIGFTTPVTLPFYFNQPSDVNDHQQISLASSDGLSIDQVPEHQQKFVPPIQTLLGNLATPVILNDYWPAQQELPEEEDQLPQNFHVFTEGEVIPAVTLPGQGPQLLATAPLPAQMNKQAYTRPAFNSEISVPLQSILKLPIDVENKNLRGDEIGTIIT